MYFHSYHSNIFFFYKNDFFLACICFFGCGSKRKFVRACMKTQNVTNYVIIISFVFFFYSIFIANIVFVGDFGQFSLYSHTLISLIVCLGSLVKHFRFFFSTEKESTAFASVAEIVVNIWRVIVW